MSSGYNVEIISAASQATNGMLLPILALEAIRGRVLRSALQRLGQQSAVDAYTLVRPQDLQDKGHKAFLFEPDFLDEELSDWWLIGGVGNDEVS
jgi:hypothetical protein